MQRELTSGSALLETLGADAFCGLGAAAAAGGADPLASFLGASAAAAVANRRARIALVGRAATLGRAAQPRNMGVQDLTVRVDL